MRNLFLTLALIVCVAGSALAAQQLVYSGRLTTSDSTNYINVKNYRTKSIAVAGHPTATSTAFSNYSGTLVINACTGNTSTAVCQPASQQDGTAISFATGAGSALSWDDAFPYMQLVWTRTGANPVPRSIEIIMFGNQY